jgi:hypothetical protein
VNRIGKTGGVRRVALQAMMSHSPDRTTEHCSRVSAEEKRAAVVASKALDERLWGAAA